MRPANHTQRPIAAIVGGVVWAMFFGKTIFGRLPLGIIELIFLLAPLVIVPLGLRLVDATRESGFAESLLRWARLIQPFAAALAVASFCPSPGVLAASLAAGWLVVCGAIGICGVFRLWRDRATSVQQICSSVGLLYLPIGGVGLVASRLGMGLMGFKEPIVLLTAVHFHYSGFAAPLLVGATGRVLNPISGMKRGILRFASWGVIVAPAFVALGFVVSPSLKILSSFLLAASLMGLSALTLEALPLIAPKMARGLLTLSAISVPAAMMLVCIYAVGDFTGHELITIPQMAVSHGILNSLGFALCGLIAWTLAAGSKPADAAIDLARSVPARPEVQRP
jgi:hypothetical protein